MTDVVTLCSECKKPIDKAKTYFCGQDGREWHTCCYARFCHNGGVAKGKWNSIAPVFGPQEYYDELERLAPERGKVGKQLEAS